MVSFLVKHKILMSSSRNMKMKRKLSREGIDVSRSPLIIYLKSKEERRKLVRKETE